MKLRAFNHASLYLALAYSSAGHSVPTQLITLAGGNIPFTYNGGAATTALSLPVLNRYADSSCAGRVIGANVWGTGSFPASPSATVYYMAPGNGDVGTLARLMCPDGATARFVRLQQINCVGGAGGVTQGGCFTATCSSTGHPSPGTATGTFPVVRCT